MLKTRVIPVLLMKQGGLYKTKKFKSPRYVGDPINTVKIFNEKEVDELVLLDIAVGKNGGEPDYSLIERIASECFMPLCYGGGVDNIDQIRRLFATGIEKVSLNGILFSRPELVREAVQVFGSQSIVASIDIKCSLFGKHKVFNHTNGKCITKSPFAFLRELEQLGVGEILLNSVNRDGMMSGFDLDFIKLFCDSTELPVVACGGAGDISDLVTVANYSEVSGVAAGSMFVFHGKHNAVLITYPNRQELNKVF